MQRTTSQKINQPQIAIDDIVLYLKIYTIGTLYSKNFTFKKSALLAISDISYNLPSPPLLAALALRPLSSTSRRTLSLLPPEKQPRNVVSAAAIRRPLLSLSPVHTHTHTLGFIPPSRRPCSVSSTRVYLCSSSGRRRRRRRFGRAHPDIHLSVPSSKAAATDRIGRISLDSSSNTIRGVRACACVCRCGD